MRRLLFTCAILAFATRAALAWGFTGHELVDAAAMQQPAPGLPAFLLTTAAIGDIVALGPEADRSKGSGKPHDPDLDPGHYLDLGDDGKIAGVVDLNALPASRRDYDTALRAVHTDQYGMGYLPYTIIDGWEQLRTDFAIWRVDSYGEQHAASASDRAAFGVDRVRREAITLHDLGYWSHFVGDGSQPLHVSVHYNGWGNYPNPNGYSTSNTVHADFEGAFVRAHATLAGVVAHMKPFSPCGCAFETRVATYLQATQSHVVPLYELEKQGAFANATPAAIDFVDARLADGATMLRDAIGEAWLASEDQKVGYPNSATPRELESGKVAPTLQFFAPTD
jgi:hypothetical protein